MARASEIKAGRRKGNIASMKKIDEQHCISMPALGFSPDPMTHWVCPEPLQSTTYFPELVSSLSGQAFAAHWGWFNAGKCEPSEPDSARDASSGRASWPLSPLRELKTDECPCICSSFASRVTGCGHTGPKIPAKG